MKNVVVLVLVFSLSIVSIFAQDWQTDFETAKNLASDQNRNIVLVFQGSDWCAPCIKLEKEILSTNEFQTFASAELVLLKADFPRKKKNRLDTEQRKRNAALAEQYNQQGIFPLVIVLDQEGKVLGETGYQKTSPSEYIKLLSSFKN